MCFYHFHLLSVDFFLVALPEDCDLGLDDDFRIFVATHYFLVSLRLHLLLVALSEIPVLPIVVDFS